MWKRIEVDATLDNVRQISITAKALEQLAMVVANPLTGIDTVKHLSVSAQA